MGFSLKRACSPVAWISGKGEGESGGAARGSKPWLNHKAWKAIGAAVVATHACRSMSDSQVKVSVRAEPLTRTGVRVNRGRDSSKVRVKVGGLSSSAFEE